MDVIVHKKITEQIIEYFKNNIKNGNWKIGEKIPSENTLTRELGVSRSSIRQAVIYYVGIGVLESVHGKGTFLVDDEVDGQPNANRITAEDCRNVENVLEFRRIVESEACYMAAQNRSDELVAKLEKYLDLMIGSREDIAKFVNADISFHRAIAWASGNPLLEKSLNRIFQENKKSQTLTRKIFGYDHGVRFHQEIISAIAAGDAEKARQGMYEHLQDGIDRLHADSSISAEK